MTKANVNQWDETAANNTDINDISLAENVMKPPAVNNAFREMMAQLRAYFKSSLFQLRDGTDETKVLDLDLSAITTGTTRTIAVPDRDVTLAPPTSAKTSAYTVTTADDQSTILCDATSAAFTVTLPAAATAGDGFVVTIKKTDSSANLVTLDGNGSETIDGRTVWLLTSQNQSVSVICDGSNWFIVGRSGFISQPAAVASNSGSAIDFVDIPSGVKRIQVQLYNVSTSSSNNLRVQIGTSSGFETTSYASSAGLVAGSTAVASATDSFLLIPSNTDALRWSGTVTLVLVDQTNNLWSFNSTLGRIGTDGVVIAGGHRSLSAALDRVRLTFSGAGSFDSGSVVVVWEF